MSIEIKSAKGYWFATVTVKSGNRYSYSCALYKEPTQREVKTLWEESRKFWRKVGKSI